MELKTNPKLWSPDDAPFYCTEPFPKPSELYIPVENAGLREKIKKYALDCLSRSENNYSHTSVVVTLRKGMEYQGRREVEGRLRSVTIQPFINDQKNVQQALTRLKISPFVNDDKILQNAQLSSKLFPQLSLPEPADCIEIEVPAIAYIQGSTMEDWEHASFAMSLNALARDLEAQSRLITETNAKKPSKKPKISEDLKKQSPMLDVNPKNSNLPKTEQSPKAILDPDQMEMETE